MEGKHIAKKQKSGPPILQMIEYKQKGVFKQDHSAAYDAYMTGFVFGHYLSLVQNVHQDCKNRIYLIGKQMPLIIEKSRFANPSKNHSRKSS